MSLQVNGRLAGIIKEAVGAGLTPTSIAVVYGSVDGECRAAINAAKSRGDQILVALVDVEDCSVVLQELSELDLLPEAWGGDTGIVVLDPRTGEGIAALRALCRAVSC